MASTLYCPEIIPTCNQNGVYPIHDSFVVGGGAIDIFTCYFVAFEYILSYFSA